MGTAILGEGKVKGTIAQLGDEEFPPVRDGWLEPKWRETDAGQKICRYYQGDDGINEVVAKRSALPDQYDIEDYELWLDHHKNITPISLSPNVNRDVQRARGRSRKTIHIHEALKYTRVTDMSQIHEAMKRFKVNREIDQRRIDAQDPEQKEKNLLRMVLEIAAEQRAAQEPAPEVPVAAQPPPPPAEPGMQVSEPKG